jgi:putative addiction module component (TIGR02574 family)
MHPSPIAQRFRELPRAEQIELLHDLWEELIQAPDGLPTTEAERQALDRRIAAVESGSTELVDWEDARVDIARNL